MNQIQDQMPYSLSLFPTFPLSRYPPNSAAAFATLTCHRKTTTEIPAPQDPTQVRQVTTDRARGLVVPEPGRRWEKVRAGEREELPWWYRRAIGNRDDWTCRICHATDRGGAEHWEVDHVIPWSAGGSDESTNLRLTCLPCNQRRSNYADPFARPMPPVISQCQDDYGADRDTRAWCGPHRGWELVPAEWARRYEASRLITRGGKHDR